MLQSQKSALSESNKKSEEDRKDVSRNKTPIKDEPLDLNTILKLPGPKRARSGWVFFVEERLNEIKKS